MTSIGTVTNANNVVGNTKLKEENQNTGKLNSTSIFSNKKADNSALSNAGNLKGNEAAKAQNLQQKPGIMQRAWNWVKKAGNYVKDKAVEFWQENKGTIKSAISGKILSKILTYIAAV